MTQLTTDRAGKRAPSVSSKETSLDPWLPRNEPYSIHVSVATALCMMIAFWNLSPCSPHFTASDCSMCVTKNRAPFLFQCNCFSLLAGSRSRPPGGKNLHVRGRRRWPPSTTPPLHPPLLLFSTGTGSESERARERGKEEDMYQTLLLSSSLFILHVMGTPQFFGPHG